MYVINFVYIYISPPATRKCPLGIESPVTLDLPNGKLAAVVQAVPPLFFKISEDAKGLLLAVVVPPVTI